MKTKPFAALAAVGIAVTIASLAISPAIAEPTPGRTLVSGSALYAIGCDSDTLPLFSVDSTTAAMTQIGDGSAPDNDDCAGQAAWDSATNTAYFLNWNDQDSLYSVDVATGVNTKVADFNGDTDGVDAIAIGTDGKGYAIEGDTLYSLDLATAHLTTIGDTGDGDIDSFAVNPVTGVFYTVNVDGQISTINVATGELTTVGSLDFGDDGDANDVWSLQIDVNGTLWLENDNRDNDDDLVADLWSVDPSDLAGSGSFSGTLSVDGEPFYSESLLLIPGIAITSGAPAASVVAGTPVSYTVTAVGSGPITFAITSGALPTGLTLDPATGVISGTPTAAGTFTFTVIASNSAGSTSATYTQTITPYLPVVSG